MKLGQVAASSVLVVAAVRGAPVPRPNVATQTTDDDWLGATHLVRRQPEPLPGVTSIGKEQATELRERSPGFFGAQSMAVGGQIVTKAAVDSSAHTLSQAVPPPQSIIGEVKHHHCIVS